MNRVSTKPNRKKRIAATIIDYIVVWGFSIFFIYTFGQPNSEGGYTLTGLPALVPVAFWFCYLVLAETFFHATAGHMIFNLEVVSADRNSLEFTQAFRRRVADVFDLHLTLGLVAFFMVKSTPLNQRLGDTWAGTIVLDRSDPEQGVIVRFDFEEPAGPAQK